MKLWGRTPLPDSPWIQPQFYRLKTLRGWTDSSFMSINTPQSQSSTPHSTLLSLSASSALTSSIMSEILSSILPPGSGGDIPFLISPSLKSHLEKKVSHLTPPLPFKSYPRALTASKLPFSSSFIFSFWWRRVIPRLWSKGPYRGFIVSCLTLLWHVCNMDELHGESNHKSQRVTPRATSLSAQPLYPVSWIICIHTSLLFSLVSCLISCGKQKLKWCVFLAFRNVFTLTDFDGGS